MKAAFCVSSFVFLTACVPWTVRPLDEKKGESTSQQTIGPAAYVDSIWDAKLVPVILTQAVDARTLIDTWAASPERARGQFGHHDGSGPTYFIVKGAGRVVSVDTHTKSRLILIDVAPYDGRPDVAIQAGPVLRGTSLRDAPGIVRFTDFVNQLQFADVGNEINNRVLKDVIGPIDLAALAGKTVSFAGTASVMESSAPQIQDLVAVRLTVDEAKR